MKAKARNGMISSGANGSGSPTMMPIATERPASTSTNSASSTNVLRRFWPIRS